MKQLRLLSVDVAKCQNEDSKGRPIPLSPWMVDVVNGIAAMQQEAAGLRQLETPAAFGGKAVPDTPEAAAARRQISITKGKDDD